MISTKKNSTSVVKYVHSINKNPLHIIQVVWDFWSQKLHSSFLGETLGSAHVVFWCPKFCPSRPVKWSSSSLRKHIKGGNRTTELVTAIPSFHPMASMGLVYLPQTYGLVDFYGTCTIYHICIIREWSRTGKLDTWKIWYAVSFCFSKGCLFEVPRLFPGLCINIVVAF